MLHIGRTRHRAPGGDKGVPGYLSVEFVNGGGWSTNGDMAQPQLGPSVINFVVLNRSSFGRLHAKIRSQVVMLGWVSSAFVVPP